MTELDCKILIIGTGPAGLGAADYAKSRNLNYEILEGAPSPFGHCKSFSIGDDKSICFDEGPHISFTKNKQVQDLFKANCPDFLTLQPVIENYWRGTYIPHPVQANLREIPEPYLSEIVEGIQHRPIIDAPKNYDEWLRTSFGDRFKELFHEVYTRKYWMLPSKEMTTDWIGERVYRPDANAMIKTASKQNEAAPQSHYITHFRYPRQGGFQSFLKKTMDQHLEKTKFNTKVETINHLDKSVTTQDGKTWNYDILVTSAPLDNAWKMLGHSKTNIQDACNKLQVSAVTLYSFVYKASRTPRNHWMYIYDQDIAFARLHFPKRLTEQQDDQIQTVQVEVYSSKQKPSDSKLNNLESVVQSLVKIGVLSASEIIASDVRFCSHANVIFDSHREFNANYILDFFGQNDILSIGRFGKWAYLWSDESYLDGFQSLKNKMQILSAEQSK